MNNTQKCKKCGRELLLIKDNFHVDRRDPTGFRHICKDCARIVFTKYEKKNKFRNKYKKPKIDFNIDQYIDVEVIKKFKELYLENALPFNELKKVSGLSVGNIHFLLDILDIRLTAKQLTAIRRENRIKELNKLRPSKEDLVEMYEKHNYSIWDIKRKCFPQVHYDIISNWFKEYKIPRRYAIRYRTSEDRLQQIIKALNERKD